MKAPEFRQGALRGAVYGCAAALSVSMTRMSGGFAMFWVATALLVPWLLTRHPRRWLPTLAACAIASILVTGLLGLGWRAAPLVALANCCEAVVDALIIRWAYRRIATVASLRAATASYIAGGVLGPLAAAAPALIGSYLSSGDDPTHQFLPWMVGHGLGFIAIFPCAALIARARASRQAILPPPGQRLSAAAYLGAIVAACAACFGQSAVPMLFLPILVLMYMMTLTDIMLSAIGLAIVIAIGVASALLDIGPLRLIAHGSPDRFIFLQFYIACISLTAMPIAMLLEKRKRLFIALAESEMRYRMLADFSTDIIMVTGLNGEISYVSPSVQQLGEWSPAELSGSSTNHLIAEQHHGEVARAHLAVIRTPGTTASVEFLGVTKGNEKRWFESHMRAIQREDGVVTGVCSVVRDISKRKRTEAELKAFALTDPLTNLANRRAFELFMSSERQGGEGYLAMFDIDRFKRVNDSFGHQAGDDVLKCFGRALRATLRTSDLGARVGGEEFVIHVHNSSMAQARIICERVRAAFTEEVARRLPGIGPVTASVGLSRFDAPLTTVLRRADAAMYRAKASGRDCLATAA